MPSAPPTPSFPRRREPKRVSVGVMPAQRHVVVRRKALVGDVRRNPSVFRVPGIALSVRYPGPFPVVLVDRIRQTAGAKVPGSSGGLALCPVSTLSPPFVRGRENRERVKFFRPAHTDRPTLQVEPRRFVPPGPSSRRRPGPVRLSVATQVLASRHWPPDERVDSPRLTHTGHHCA